jgi:putative salt-induced outer membrane protein
MRKWFTVRGVLLFLISICIVPNIHAEEMQNEGQWKIRTEISLADTSGNTDIQTISGKLEIKKEGPINRYFLNGRILQVKDRDRETSNKVSSEARWERGITERLFALLSAGYIRDIFSGYEYRLFGGPGMGYTFIDTGVHRLQWLISSIYYHDEFSGEVKGSDDYLAGKTTLKYEWKILENLKFKETLDSYISFKNKDKYFVDSESAIEVKVNKSVSIGINYVVNYQNILPAPGVEHTDTTFLTTLIIDF